MKKYIEYFREVVSYACEHYHSPVHMKILQKSNLKIFEQSKGF